MKALILVIACALLASTAGAQTPAIGEAEVIREVRVHGNHTTPDTDIITLAGLAVGGPASTEVIAAAEQRLRESGRFSNVEVRKRFRSITEAGDILVIVLVNERPGVSSTDLTPGALKRLRGSSMWLPVLDYADGYGFTYGARIGFVDVLGSRSRVSLPFTWGGERQVALDVERRFARGPFTRLEGSLSLTRRENPHYEIGDTRRRANLRAERVLTSWLRVGGDVGAASVAFGDADSTHTSAGIDLALDTRRDPAFPRNAIHSIIGIEHLAFSADHRVTRRWFDFRGYVGLFGSSVLELRTITSHADAPLPAYEQRLLGGTSLLRGYRFGYRAGDNLAALSAELRIPLTSPLNIGRFGVKTFFDSGAVYAHGQKLSRQPFDRGVGGGVFLTATVVRMGLDVAWPRREPKNPRWHFGLGVTF